MSPFSWFFKSNYTSIILNFCQCLIRPGYNLIGFFHCLCFCRNNEPPGDRFGDNWCSFCFLVLISRYYGQEDALCCLTHGSNRWWNKALVTMSIVPFFSFMILLSNDWQQEKTVCFIWILSSADEWRCHIHMKFVAFWYGSEPELPWISYCTCFDGACSILNILVLGQSGIARRLTRGQIPLQKMRPFYLHLLENEKIILKLTPLWHSLHSNWCFQ